MAVADYDITVTSKGEAESEAKERQIVWLLHVREKVEATIKLKYKPGVQVIVEIEGPEADVAKDIVTMYQERGWTVSYTAPRTDYNGRLQKGKLILS